jgi:hypothetical protein
METRRFNTRNGTDLAFSVIGQGMGPMGAGQSGEEVLDNWVAF